ncbi:MAG: alpha/beta hydrolase [Phreatobacter sp.]|uniref:alpha/beta fold hydrolase n=1 Tax=Phreatobacter sp. TaxID=1966341 RepID=UPI00273272A8|nr:alpha/beta hydrolase [Phreatobacter sp.]MDP2803813.1 alpha/beta hydrolase [Phreatobacter sp.]
MERFRAEDGARLAYRDEGDGLPLLALAGLTRDGRDFDYLVRRLPHDVRLIRLDSRGRGESDWTGPDTYTVPQETRDVLALLDHLNLAQAAIIGSSRGGLIGMVIAAMAKHRLLGLCLNDVGAVLERAGLERIATYVGVEPAVATLDEVADRLPAVMPGFVDVPDLRWAEETVRHFVQREGAVGLTYDPALRDAVQAAMAQPLPEFWSFFEACDGLPLALIRGEASDVLSKATATEMRRRRPDMAFAELRGRGHVPFLDEPEAITCIVAWLGEIKLRMAGERPDVPGKAAGMGP